MADPNDASLRIPFGAVGKAAAEVGDKFRLNEAFVGVPGKEELSFVADGEWAASPEAASVRRNSTHSRENDWGCSLII